MAFVEKRPVLLSIRSSTWFITTAVCYSVFTDIFLYGVIVPVIPFALRERAQVAEHEVQHWVSVLLAVYGGALLIGSPIAGIIADRISSRRVPMLSGLIVLTGATLMLCLGRSVLVLIVGRLLQGASAAVVWTVALALLADTIESKNSGTAMGFVSIGYSLCLLLAPLLGGIVYAQAGYYPTFGMIFGVISVDILLRLLFIEKKFAVKWLGQDAANEGSNVVDQDLQCEEKTSHPVSVMNDADARPEGQVSNAASSMERDSNRHRKDRKLPSILILLKSPRMLSAFWGNFVIAAVTAGFDATLPLFSKETFGWNSQGAGLLFLAFVIPSFMGPLIGWFCDKYGVRWIAAGGLLFMLPFLVLLRLVNSNDISDKVLLCALLALVGFAAAISLTPLMAEFSKICDEKERQDPDVFSGRSTHAQSYGLFSLAWALGYLIGPLWGAGVKDNAGWGTMTWTFGLVVAVSAIPVATFSGGRIELTEFEPSTT